MNADIVVVGSVNVDRSVRVRRLPSPGQTISGSEVTTNTGGKGANQARAAARLGASVAMIACVGDDRAGARARGEIAASGVRVEAVQRRAERPTGTALITVDEAGENTIVLAPGANALLSGDLTARAGETLPAPGAVVAQGETPVSSIAAAARLAQDRGARFVLNLAPVLPLPPELLAAADPLIVNEHEAALLLGTELSSLSSPDAEPAVRAAGALVRRGCRAVVITLGGAGAVWAGRDGGGGWMPAASAAEVVDTAGAGDACVAAIAVSLAAGTSLPEAVARGNVVGAHVVGQHGASPSMPSPADIAGQARQLVARRHPSPETW